MNFHLSWEAAERKIETLCRQHPFVRSLAKKLVVEQKAANAYSATQIYDSILWHYPDLAPTGYWETIPRWACPPQVRARKLVDKGDALDV